MSPNLAILLIVLIAIAPIVAMSFSESKSLEECKRIAYQESRKKEDNQTHQALDVLGIDDPEYWEALDCLAPESRNYAKVVEGNSDRLFAKKLLMGGDVALIPRRFSSPKSILILPY